MMGCRPRDGKVVVRRRAARGGGNGRAARSSA